MMICNFPGVAHTDYTHPFLKKLSTMMSQGKLNGARLFNVGLEILTEEEKGGGMSTPLRGW